MMDLKDLLLAVVAISGGAFGLESCGSAQYDPAEYVCHDGNFLCAVIAGEALGRCGSACYSKFMYTCNNGILDQLPRQEGSFSLTVSNPAILADGWPVTACGLRWWLGGDTCSYCAEQVPAESCPAGDDTLVYSSSGMAVLVPGGQQYYLDPFWSVGYTQAHSAAIPSGSTVGGFAAFEGGGFVNLNPSALGWVACYPTASGGGGNDGRWSLAAKNTTNVDRFNLCYDVNLEVHADGGLGAWQYT